MKRLIAIVLSTFGFWSTAIQAADEAGFNQYIEGVKQQALEQGISSQTLDQAFADVRFIKRTVKLDRSQPEKKQTLDTYLPKRSTTMTPSTTTTIQQSQPPAPPPPSAL